MARVALDRLGETRAGHRPAQSRRLRSRRRRRASAQLTGSNVIVVADAPLGRGGCRVESDFGILDAGVDAQIQEIAQALLGTAPTPTVQERRSRVP